VLGGVREKRELKRAPNWTKKKIGESEFKMSGTLKGGEGADRRPGGGVGGRWGWGVGVGGFPSGKPKCESSRNRAGCRKA